MMKQNMLFYTFLACIILFNLTCVNTIPVKKVKNATTENFKNILFFTKLAFASYLPVKCGRSIN